MISFLQPSCLLFFFASTVVNAQSLTATDQGAKLDLLPAGAPALKAWLGDPGKGAPKPANRLRMEWNPNGRIFVSNDQNASTADEYIIQTWSPPSGKTPSKFKRYLSAAHSWSFSNSGEMLCTQVYLPTEEYPFHDKGEYNAVSCFRFADAGRLWKVSLAENERLQSTCFSRDDKKILIALERDGFCSLRLLDADNGEVISSVSLPGSGSNFPSTRSIVATKDGFVVLTKQGLEGSILYQVPLGPLSADPAPFQELSLGGFDHLLVSKNEKYLVLYGTRGYRVLSLQGNKWKSYLDGSVLDIWSGDGSFLQACSLSPNDRLLFVATASESKVIDLEAQKLVKDLSVGSYGSAFSPDGNILLTGAHSGITAWATQTWSKQPVETTQHDCPVLGVHFLPDGKNLISHDHNGFIVWDVASGKPRAFLKGARDEQGSQFGHFAFANQMSSLVAGDGWDFLQWKLPDLQKPVPAGPEEIIGSKAFGDLASQNEGCKTQEVYADLSGRYFITLSDHEVQLRDIKNPARMKTLSSLRGIGFGAEAHVIFLEEGKLCIHDYDHKMHHVDLTADQLTTVAEHGDARSKGLWLPNRKCYVMQTKVGIQFIDALTGKVTQTLLRPKDPSYRSIDFTSLPNRRVGVTVSKDEKIAAVYMDTVMNSNPRISLWDIDSGDLLALQSLPSLDINCLDFSTDGKTLAVGHTNSGISLWDVELMLKNKLSNTATPVSATTQPNAAYRFVRESKLPESGLLDLQGNKWTFSPDGSLSIDARLPVFGLLKVNGKALVNRGSQYLKNQANEKIGDSVSIHNVGEIEGGSVWVSRTLSSFAMAGINQKTMLQAVDGLTNITDAAIETEISFQVQFPPDSQGLLRAADEPISIPSDGRFSLTGDDLWVAAAGTGKAGEPLAAVRLQSWARSSSPDLHWDADQKLLTATYRVQIPAGETRWMIHSLALLNRFAEGSINAVEAFPFHADIGHYMPAGNRLQSINFSLPDLWNEEHRKGPLPSAMGWSSEDPKPKPDSDSMGFGWEKQHDQSRLGEFGATSVHQLWINKHPAGPIGLKSLLHFHVNGKLVMHPFIQFRDIESGLDVSRTDGVMPGDSATVWQDRFSNTHDETRSVKISYVTTFKSPVVEVWDALGKKHNPSEVTGSTSVFGGGCAFVLEGGEKLATLLAFHREGSALAPSIRWIGPKAIALDYEFQLMPKETAYLLHGACQRPLGAFESVSDAFADWAPLQLPQLPSKPGSSQTSSTGKVPVIPLNYRLDLKQE